MSGGGRGRSSSFAAMQQQEGSPKGPSLEALDASHKLWELVCYAMEDPLSKQTLLHSSSNVCLIKALLDRAHHLDHYSQNFKVAGTVKGGKNLPTTTSSSTGTTTTDLGSSHWLATMLKLGDGESGYTPLHRAVLKADLPVLLLLLRYATSLQQGTAAAASDELTSVLASRLQHRPLALLRGEIPNLNEDVRAVFQAVDNEGLTAFQLLERLQVRELEQCRKSITFSPLEGGTDANDATRARRPRQNSFEAMLQQDHAAQQQPLQNEFAELHEFVQQEQQQRREENDFHQITMAAAAGRGYGVSYACEVLAFGRSNHLALGVQGGKNYEERTSCATAGANDSTNTTATTTTFRPHRVQTFAQDRVGREGSAVAVAAAAHHTLVATRNGHLYAFGVGTGGRLGTGDNEKHCPAPTRVLGPLGHRRVVAIAAAENHSLCVTSDGAVYAFGSNRFGQLGYSSTTNNNSGDTHDQASAAGSSSSRCCLPRRVDDLWKKHVLCVSVAAGEKHSVALSQKGEVYVWGCNASGQLGIHRRSTSNSGLAHKVQRVDALWNDEKRRICFQVAASSQATLVLAKPSASGGLPVNQVYAWGHGNHVPSKVQFVDTNDTDSRRSSSSGNKQNVFLAASGRRSINPVAIACARHHNAAITSDGRVYTWGFHADSLGGSSSSSKASTTAATPKSASKNACSRPQLVTGMLPEEGGGFAVAVSASENHTAVVTNEGSLFTWGASYGKGVMGHEGVRFQPSPKLVPGISRAVGVSAGKEHTILLVGASFPATSHSSSGQVLSLERLAAQEVVKHVDLFNVLPILMTAERINSRYVMEYCYDFIRLNMDGILNVGQKSTMDMYLKEQVASGLLLLDEDPRDRRERPLVLEVALAARRVKTGLMESETILSHPVDWIQSCEKLFKKDSLTALLNRMRKTARERSTPHDNPKYFRRRSSSSVGSASEAYNNGYNRKRSSSFTSDVEKVGKMSSSERCIMLTTNMDLSTRELVQAKYDCLTREVRGLKKRLSQIAKLESIESEDDPENPAKTLSAEQREKVARRPQLESELCIFEPALERVERRMLHFNLRLKRLGSVGGEDDEAERKEKGMSEETKQVEPPEVTRPNAGAVEIVAEVEPKGTGSLRCALCKITCPDEKSYALHMNGRKHRNRVAQEAEEEKKKAAASMMEERHRQQMEQMTKSAEARACQASTPSAWSKPKIDSKSTVKPKYKLPQPTHSPEEMVEKLDRRKSFQEIMAEEAKKARQQSTGPTGPRSKATSRASMSLQLPPGSAPSLKSPPWAGKSLVMPSTSKQSPMSPPLARSTGPSKSNTSAPWLPVSPARAAASLQLPPEAAPPLKSPPWIARTTTKTPASAQSITSSSLSPPGQASKVSSFGDFLRNAASATPQPSTPGRSSAAASAAAPWSASATPKQVPGSSLVAQQGCKPSPGASVRFEEIQKQEEDFRNNVQDQSYQDNSSWFIERRERAGSFTAIQEAATRQREEELMIEEQKRIEEQIQRELAEQRKKEAKKRKQQAIKRAKQQKKVKDANKNSNDNDDDDNNNNNSGDCSSQPPKNKNKNNKPGNKNSKKGKSKQDPQQEAAGKATPSNQNKNKGNNNRRNSNKNRRKSGKESGTGNSGTPAGTSQPVSAS